MVVEKTFTNQRENGGLGGRKGEPALMSVLFELFYSPEQRKIPLAEQSEEAEVHLLLRKFHFLKAGPLSKQNKTNNANKT